MIRSLITGIKTVDFPTCCQIQFCYFFFFFYLSQIIQEKALSTWESPPSSPLSKTWLYNLCCWKYIFSLSLLTWFPLAFSTWLGTACPALRWSWDGRNSQSLRGRHQLPLQVSAPTLFCVCIMCSYHKSPLSGTGAAVAELRNVLEQSVCSLHTLEWDPSCHLHPGLLSEPLLCRVLSGVTEQERPRGTQRFSTFCPEGPSAGTLIGLRASGGLSAS